MSPKDNIFSKNFILLYVSIKISQNCITVEKFCPIDCHTPEIHKLIKTLKLDALL